MKKITFENLLSLCRYRYKIERQKKDREIFLRSKDFFTLKNTDDHLYTI